MQFTSESVDDALLERRFMVDDVPGILWTPAATPAEPTDVVRSEGDRGRPLILLGHGGGQHKAAPGMVGRARRFAADGFAVAAIDAPGHGDRPRTDRDRRFSAGMAERMSAGEPVGEYVAAYHAAVAEQAVGDWKSVLDALQDLMGKGRVGYWGVSLGAAIGLPFLAADSRVGAAVVGLVGADLVPVRAARVTIPVEFLVQWDDELVPRPSALELFDALASTEKTLHANPGPHAGVPPIEVESAARFFLRHLA
jgi:pimeloyl-ACP methyl ester carboxylesterase